MFRTRDKLTKEKKRSLVGVCVSTLLNAPAPLIQITNKYNQPPLSNRLRYYAMAAVTVTLLRVPVICENKKTRWIFRRNVRHKIKG